MFGDSDDDEDDKKDAFSKPPSKPSIGGNKNAVDDEQK